MNDYKFYLKLTVYFILLYFLTVIYNIANKRVLNVLPLPALVACSQLLLGIPLFLPIWIVKLPKYIDTVSMLSYSKIALAHGLGNLATIYSLSSGSVSFTHIIKSAEPIFTALLSAALLKDIFNWEVYATLLPIVGGVALSSVEEFSFTWFGFINGMLSNLFYQLRIVLSKQLIENGDPSRRISSTNLFRVLTIISFLQLLPVALILEGRQMITVWQSTVASFSIQPNYLYFNILVAGFTYYMYNEVAFWILDLVHPVTQAVGNTIKRVVLIIISIIIFQQPITNRGIMGATMAILGSFLYAIIQHRQKIKPGIGH